MADVDDDFREFLAGGEMTPALPDSMLMAFLETAFKNHRMPLTNEKEAQRCISEMLTQMNFTHEREVRLGDRDIVDFWLPWEGDEGRVLEVKMNSARPADVLRQLQRYCAHPRVQAIFLVTNKAMGLPAEIEGKPAYYISLGRAWL